jgi:hypothetical protein
MLVFRRLLRVRQLHVPLDLSGDRQAVDGRAAIFDDDRAEVDDRLNGRQQRLLPVFLLVLRGFRFASHGKVLPKVISGRICRKREKHTLCAVGNTSLKPGSTLISPSHQFPFPAIAASQPPGPCVFRVRLPSSAALFRRAKAAVEHDALCKSQIVVICLFQIIHPRKVLFIRADVI